MDFILLLFRNVRINSFNISTKKSLIWICIFLPYLSVAQNSLKITLKDSITQETLIGASVNLPQVHKAANTDVNGSVSFSALDSGVYAVNARYVGYKDAHFSVILSTPLDTVFYLAPTGAQLEEVVVTSTRTNARIEDLPVKVEVLGKEEMDEENQIKPSNVGSILGDISIIHIQQTSAVSANTVIRMQGLSGKYTQILRDGLPLFEGFSGNLGVLSIPPLDLKQVEVIKGSASTLYGGGAIAGIVNLISNTPNEPKLSFTLNRSTLKESNANAYYSRKWNKLGLSFLAQQTLQEAKDVNKDQLSDVPEINSTVIHPRVFYTVNSRQKLDAGYSLQLEKRLGGAMDVLPSLGSGYFEQNKTQRQTLDGHYQSTYNNGSFNIKAAFSDFRNRATNANYAFEGGQQRLYTEANRLFKTGKNELVTGLNYINSSFTRRIPATSQINNFSVNTVGAFIQDDWHLTNKFLVEPGLRVDNNKFDTFILPRLAFMYKPTTDLSLRLSGGLGYKNPDVFAEDNDLRNYSALTTSTEGIRPERSQGLNFDGIYHWMIGDISAYIDQALYVTQIKYPVQLTEQNGALSLQNLNSPYISYGTDTYFRMFWNELELYLGYNHTIAKMKNEASYLPLSPQDKFSTTVAYEVEEKWRLGLENSYIGKQYLPDQQNVQGYWFWAGMVEKKFNHASLVLNCENLFDFRQSRKEALYTGAVTNPQFKPLWAPIDGRVVNLALRVTL